MPRAYTFDFQDGEYFWAVEFLGEPISLMIGRQQCVDVPVPSQFDTVSRRHACIIHDGKRYWIENYSKNLTWVDGEFVPSFREFEPPCDLRLGNVHVHLDLREIDQEVLDAMPAHLSALGEFGGDVRTTPVEDLDWEEAMRSLGFTAHWASASFQIAQLIARESQPDALHRALQHALASHLRAMKVQISFDVLPDGTDEEELKRYAPTGKQRAGIRALSVSNPIFFGTSQRGRHVLWAVHQSADGVPRAAVASAVFPENAVGNASSEEATWLVLTTLQTGMAAILRLRRLATYAYSDLLGKEKRPSQATLAAARELNIRGNSKAFQECLHAVEIAATRHLEFNTGEPGLKTILLRGDIGSGKSVLAKLIHQLSARRDQVFLHRNAASIVSTLAESELFGMCAGWRDYPESKGLFGEAVDATLFLDEVGNLDISTQAKLLTVLTTGLYNRVGETGRDRETNANVIMAANQNLEALSDVGDFKADLLSRVRMCTIRIPPLRERKEEIPQHVTDGLRRFRENNPGCELQAVSESLMDAFLAYDWPENLRELMGLLHNAAICAPDGTRIIDWEHLDRTCRERLLSGQGVSARPGCDASRSWQENELALEREYVARLLGLCEGVLGDMKKRSKLAAGTLNEKERRLREYLKDAGPEEVKRIRALAGKGWERIDPGT